MEINPKQVFRNSNMPKSNSSDSEPVSIQFVNSPIATSTANPPLRSVPKTPSSRLPLIIALGVIILGIGGYFAFRALSSDSKPESVQPAPNNPLRGTASEEEKAKPSYTLETSSETGTYELFGSDESKNNSSEAFVDYQTAIINSKTSSTAEVFNAQISLISYYNATGLTDEAQTIISSIDQGALSDEQKERLTRIIEESVAP